MYEIRWNGRAGQGIITVSRLLGYAAILEGKHAQAFPQFGPERIGAPIVEYIARSINPTRL
jgi:pyruvate ferredoxin oxidoreductase gamma subunit